MSAPARIERDGPVAHVILDVPGADVNLLDEPVLVALGAAVAGAADLPGVRAIVLRSGKESGFCAGADVKKIASIANRAEAERLVRLGQDTYRRIERSSVPVVAAIHGPCVGGGLELALACHGILASDEQRTRLGLPETQLGIIPGFGGTQRLPPRVGVVTATDMILSGRLLRAKAALRAGLLDDLVCPFFLVREAAAYALALADGGPRRGAARRQGFKAWIGRIGFARRFVLSRARATVMKRTAGVYPAPLRALELIDLAFQGDRERGFAREVEVIGELLEGTVAHRLAGLYLRTEALKRKAGDARGVGAGDVVGVVGAGVMGAAIARLFLARGATVRLFDTKPEAARAGMAHVAAAIQSEVRKGRLPARDAARQMDRLQPAVGLAGLTRARLVVEAVVERLDVKRAVFADLERACGPETALYTNTSSLRLADIRSSLERPERLLGLHFFNPVDRMPLVEVVAPEGADANLVRGAIAAVRDAGKVPVVVRDAPGFAVNRVLAPYLSEALLLLEEGVPPGRIDRAVTALGFPMGPLRVLDAVGLDVATAAAESLRASLGDRLAAPRIGLVLRDEGHLGEKSGGGIHVRDRSGSRVPAPWLDDALRKARTQGGATPRAVGSDDVRDRLLFALLAESARAFEDRITEEAADLDVAMVLGAGFPAALGGPLHEIDRRGADAVVARLAVLRAAFGPRFTPGADLEERGRSKRPYLEDGPGGP